MKLSLPLGTSFEIQMQYGSIGWSVGAVLGYAMATAGPMNEQGERQVEKQKTRVIGMIGDGSFQLTAQEISYK